MNGKLFWMGNLLRIIGMVIVIVIVRVMGIVIVAIDNQSKQYVIVTIIY